MRVYWIQAAVFAVVAAGMLAALAHRQQELRATRWLAAAPSVGAAGLLAVALAARDLVDAAGAATSLALSHERRRAQ